MATFHSSLAALTLGVGNLSLSGPLFGTDIEFVRVNSTDRLPDEPAFLLIPTYARLSFGLRLTFVTASFFLVSAAAHAGNAVVWRGWYESDLSRGRCTSRWVEYSISAPIMILLVAYGAGVREYTLLGALFALIATTMFFGYLTERGAVPASEAEWTTPFSHRIVPHALGYVPQTAAWACLLVNFYDEPYEERPPAYVHAIVWSQLLLFASFGFVQLYQQASPPSSFVRGEVAYQTLSLVCKGTLGGLMLANVLVLGDVSDMF